MVAIEAGGDDVVGLGIGQQVSGKLRDGELIPRHVAVERVDDPVAPAPHVAGTVGLIAVAVTVAGILHPAVGHFFTVGG